MKNALHQHKMHAPLQRSQKTNKPFLVERQPTFLPYLKGVTDNIGVILRKAPIKTIFKYNKKVTILNDDEIYRKPGPSGVYPLVLLS